MKIELELNDKNNGKSIDIYIEDEKGYRYSHFYDKEAENVFYLVRDLIDLKTNDILERKYKHGKNKSNKFRTKRNRNRS